MPNRAVVAQLANETAALKRLPLRRDPSRKEQVAHQLWRGERIVSERCFYDPAQRLPIARSVG